VRQQLVLRHVGRRAGVDVVDLDVAGEHHPARQRGVVAAGVDDDLVAVAPQRRGQRGDVHVLAPRVDAAEHGQRAGVLRDHGDPHRATAGSGTTDANSASQSARNRRRP
jgi:hypothetical protein